MARSVPLALLAMLAMAGLGALPAHAQKPGPPAGESASRAGDEQGTVLDRDYLIGRWTDNGDCSAAVDLVGDGRFVNADGTAGVWNVEADRLTMTGAQATIILRIRVIDRNSITVINPDRSVGHSTRC